MPELEQEFLGHQNKFVFNDGAEPDLTLKTKVSRVYYLAISGTCATTLST